MKIKTEVIHVQSDQKKFKKELEKVYAKAASENVSEKPPEIQFNFTNHGFSHYAALVIWFVN